MELIRLIRYHDATEDMSSDPTIEFLAELAEARLLMAEAMRPIATMMEQIAENIRRQTPEINEIISRTLEPFRVIVLEIAAAQRQSELLNEAGWLPHVTTPFHLIEECAGNTVRLSESIESYYKENWSQIRADLIARIETYKINEEAKSTFREALMAHEQGFYRAVCRLVLPEIERVARIELHNGALGNVTAASGKPTSVPAHLQEIVGDQLSLSEMEPRGVFGLALFRRFREHLYAQVRDQVQLRRVEADAIPNRHAAVHGLVVYSSIKNSLNSLFMTDYVFQMISNLLKNQEA